MKFHCRLGNFGERARHKTPLPRIIFTLFILLYILIGITIFRDVGLSIDEPFERDIGMSNVKFLLHKLNLHRFLCEGICEADLVVDLNYLPDRIYGSWFQIVSIILEAITGASGMEIFHIRHILLFCVSTVGLIFLYRTVTMLHKNEWIALAVVLLFAIQPRFFGESFYNSKDMLLVAITHIAFYYLLRFLRKPWRKGFFITAGVLTGLTIATRVTGIMMFTGVLILLLLDLCVARRRRRLLIGMGGYILASAFFTILFWPYLWNQPLARFLESVAGMSRYPLHTQVLLNGQSLNSANLPWDYAAQWILVTVPELVILLLLAGFVILFREAIRREGLIKKYRRLKNEIFALGLFLGPMFVVVVWNSVLYDGWRHLYFTFCAGFLLIAFSLKEISAHFKPMHFKFAMALLLVPGAFYVYQMVKLHPFQNLYFNSMARKPLRYNYELDYWGLTYRKGLEYILANDQRPRISVYFFGNAMQLQFANGSSDRLVYEKSSEKADYFLTTYRFHRDDYPGEKEVYTLWINNEKSLSVFRRDRDPQAR